MKKKILSVLLSFTLIFSTTGFAFADTDLDNPPAKPDKPKVETYKDNDKAREYNKEAKEYNKDVDKYNAAVDKEYDKAVADTNQKNAEGQAKQEASQKAHDDAVAANEAEQARVDSENAKIDEQNAAGAASVGSHNASEDAKVEQNKKDREAAEAENATRKAQYDADVEAAEKEYEEAVNAEKERIETIKAENEQIRQHNAEEDQKVADTEVANKAEKERIDAENAERESKYYEDVAQYEVDKAKYDEDYANYTSTENQTDIKNEQIILNAGYTSIGEYNMLPLKSGPVYDEETGTYIDNPEEFEKLLEKAVYRKEVRQENNALKEKEYISTINVQEAEEKSGETYTLYLTHYLSNGQTYEETITFDANDTITVKSLAYADNSKPLYEDENYGAFYNYQGDKYLSRYWYQTYGSFEYPPLKNELDHQEVQDKGNSYTFSYKNGKKYASDSNEIYITYYYNSQLTANIPLSEPTAPTEPTLELLGFEPIVYNPDYLEELDETENIIEKRAVEEPEYVEVPEIYNPSYETYTPIEHISPVFVDVPDVETWVNLPDPVKREYLKHVSLLGLLPVPTKTNTPSTPRPSEMTIIFTDDTPTENNPATTNIKNTNTPLMNRAFAPTGEWALINLIAMLLTFLIAIILIISLAINKIREVDDDKEYNNKAIKRILTIIASIISGIVFLLTEDMTLPMVLIDKWTIVMIVILLINIIIAILSRRKEKESEEEE